MLFQAVDAADHRGLARAGRPAHHDAFARRHVQVDVAQHVELAIPLVHVLQTNNGIGHACTPVNIAVRARLAADARHWLAFVISRKTFFKRLTVLGHGKAEHEVDQRDEEIRLYAESAPCRVGQGRLGCQPR
ncbi:hypothetical protein G6F60_014276 [Rhizopus arrhizus]|nr:hypothetical protein G6F60_014276 [Rhizopus arrhizus]